MNNFNSWQEFEEFVKEILEKHDFEIKFREVFSDNKRKYEIDVVGYHPNFILSIDCKFYGASRRRTSRLKQEARKHLEKTRILEESVNQKCIPIIITFLDDELIMDENCLYIPVQKLNNFLNNIYFYLEEFGFI